MDTLTEAMQLYEQLSEDTDGSGRQQFSGEEKALYRSLMTKLRAGQTIFDIVCHEENPLISVLSAVRENYLNMQNQPRHIVTWNVAMGFSTTLDKERQSRCMTPDAALNALSDFSRERLKDIPHDAIVVFHDMDRWVTPSGSGAIIARLIRNLYEHTQLFPLTGGSYNPKESERINRIVIFTGHNHLPDASPKLFSERLEMPLPGRETLWRRVTDTLQNYLQPALDPATDEAHRARLLKWTKAQLALRDRFASALLGLSTAQAEAVTAEVSLSCTQLPDTADPAEHLLPKLFDLKASKLEEHVALRYVPLHRIPAVGELCGMDNLFGFLDKCRKAYSEEARLAGVNPLRGMILVGVPGTGKSAVALAAGRYLSLPVYMLDFGAMLHKHVGESERNLREALRMIDAQDECIVVFDELDKTYPPDGSASSDGGITSRMRGALQTWLADRTCRAFVIATMNRFSVPQELLRAGRFDATFFTELPSAEERISILDVKLRKYNTSLAALGFDNPTSLRRLQDDTDGFSGAELDRAVREAALLAFDRTNTGVIAADDLLRAIPEFPPASASSDEFKELTDTFRKQAKPVSSSRGGGFGQGNRASDAQEPTRGRRARRINDTDSRN